jgi:PadR family transcriptional regulator PadR
VADAIEVSKDSLDVILLYAVSHGPAPGYGIRKWIGECSAGAFCPGRIRLLYALRRLEKRKFITSEWRVMKTKRIGKFYQVTALGTSYFAAAKAEWFRVAASMARMFAAQPDLVGAAAIHDSRYRVVDTEWHMHSTEN